MDRLFRRITLYSSAHNKEVLKAYLVFVKNATIHLGIESSDVIAYPYTRWLQYALKSKFAKKKYKVQYETRNYLRHISIHNVTGSTASTFLEYVERNIPEGVALKVSYEEISPLLSTVEHQNHHQTDTSSKSPVAGSAEEYKKTRE